MTKVVCAGCSHQIDAAARLCPYCSADPRTGEKLVDAQAVLQEVFRPRELSTSESVVEYARQRQGIVIGVSIAVIFLGLALLHQFVTRRNATAAAASPAVPLTEVSDLSNQETKESELPMPDLDFQYQGQPKRMQTFIVEAGAIMPPDAAAIEQQAASAAQTRPAAAAAQPPAQGPAPSPPEPLAQPVQPDTASAQQAAPPPPPGQ